MVVVMMLRSGRTVDELLSRLYRQFSQRQAHACGYVDDDLLRHRVVYCAAEDGVAAEKTCEKRIVLSLLARGRCVAEKEHSRFVREGEEAEVARVLPRCFVHEQAF